MDLSEFPKVSSDKIGEQWKEEYFIIKQDSEKRMFWNKKGEIIFMLWHIIKILCKLLYK